MVVDIDIVEELRPVIVLSTKNIMDLRNYISLKHAASTSGEKAAILADAINRIIDGRTPELPAPHKENLRKSIIKASVARNFQDISLADVFEECVKIAEDTGRPDFHPELCSWMSRTIQREIRAEELTAYMRNTSGNADPVQAPEPESKAADGAVTPDNAAGGAVAPDNAVDADVTPDNGAVRPDDAGGQITLVESLYFDYIHGKGPDEADLFAVTSRTKGKRLPFSLARGIAAAVLIVFYTIFVYKLVTHHIGPGATVYAEQVVYENEDVFLQPANTASRQPNESGPPVVSAGGLPGDSTSPEGESGTVKGVKMVMRATAYDLSLESCGKERSHPEYGVTFSGAKATAGRTIAVDPRVIPIGSRVRIAFPDEYKQLDGEYVAEDTGRLVKGNCVDIFFGEDRPGERTVYAKVKTFGVRKVTVTVLQ